jgi:hypothetical protein
MLGLLTEQVQGRLEEWTRRFIQRVEQEVSDRSLATALLDGAYILLGLLYDAGEIERWFAGAQGMKELSTYRRMWSNAGHAGVPLTRPTPRGTPTLNNQSSEMRSPDRFLILMYSSKTFCEIARATMCSEW